MIRRPDAWAVGWAVLIEVLLLWPSPPTVSQRLLGLSLDTFAHAVLFAGQAALLAWALRVRGRRVWPAAAAAIVFGALTELQQHFLPSRAMELSDLLADATGAVIGAAAFAALALRRREFER